MYGIQIHGKGIILYYYILDLLVVMLRRVCVSLYCKHNTKLMNIPLGTFPVFYFGEDASISLHSGIAPLFQ